MGTPMRLEDIESLGNCLNDEKILGEQLHSEDLIPKFKAQYYGNDGLRIDPYDSGKHAQQRKEYNDWLKEKRQQMESDEKLAEKLQKQLRTSTSTQDDTQTTTFSDIVIQKLQNVMFNNLFD